jgi:hypothetical protein
MSLGMTVCPKCKGQGKIRYRVWDSHSLIGHFIAYKKGENLDDCVFNLKLLKIICPMCDGDGCCDWVRVVMRSKVRKNFKILTGNMDIYFAKCLNKWIPNRTHQMQWIKVSRMFRNPDKLIELSQRHYNPKCVKKSSKSIA